MAGDNFPGAFFRDEVDFFIPPKKLVPINIELAKLTLIEFHTQKVRTIFEKPHFFRHAGTVAKNKTSGNAKRFCP